MGPKSIIQLTKSMTLSLGISGVHFDGVLTQTWLGDEVPGHGQDMLTIGLRCREGLCHFGIITFLADHSIKPNYATFSPEN